MNSKNNQNLITYFLDVLPVMLYNLSGHWLN